MSSEEKRIHHVSREIQELMNELEEEYLMLGGDEVLDELRSIRNGRKDVAAN